MYKVTFEDDTIFEGGSPTESKWNDMPKKRIKKLEYTIGNQTILMEGYEAYNHATERHYKVSKGVEIKILWLMVKKENDIMIIKYDLRTRRIDYDVAEWGKEWRGKPTSGWKLGIPKGKAVTKIF